MAITMSVFGPNFNHFTWFGLFVFGVGISLGYVAMDHHTFWIRITIYTMIVFGVNIMSVSKCDVFENAFTTYGAWKYAVGHFMMHYFPPLVEIMLCTQRHVYCGPVKATGQIWTGLGIYLVWLYRDKPMVVYGCRLTSVLGTIGAFIITMLMQVVVMVLYRDG